MDLPVLDVPECLGAATAPADCRISAKRVGQMSRKGLKIPYKSACELSHWIGLALIFGLRWFTSLRGRVGLHTPAEIGAPRSRQSAGAADQAAGLLQRHRCDHRPTQQDQKDQSYRLSQCRIGSPCIDFLYQGCQMHGRPARQRAVSGSRLWPWSLFNRSRIARDGASLFARPSVSKLLKRCGQRRRTRACTPDPPTPRMKYGYDTCRSSLRSVD